MPSLLIYGLIALGIIASLGGIGWKIDHNGYVRGAGEEHQKWQAATDKAKAAAEADRVRQDALRQAQDAQTTRRLTDEKKRSQTLMASLEAHIRASGAAAACPLPDSLRDDWNRANSGPEGAGTGTVPPAGGKPAPTH